MCTGMERSALWEKERLPVNRKPFPRRHSWRSGGMFGDNTARPEGQRGYGRPFAVPTA